MAAITASMVAELRAKTDAPMMECKKALTEADGDFAKAEEILRVKLGSKASKAASRVTAEGVVSAYVDGSTGALVEINCETDFVSKNDSFLAFGKSVAELIAKNNPADVAAIGELPLSQDGFGPTVEEVRKGLIGKIGENMAIRRFKRFGGGNALGFAHQRQYIAVARNQLGEQHGLLGHVAAVIRHRFVVALGPQGDALLPDLLVELDVGTHKSGKSQG